MPCLEYYCKRALLIGGFPLEEASEQGIHFGNKGSFLLFFLHNLDYVWYISTNLDISVLQVLLEPFPWLACCKKIILVVENWGKF